MGEAESRKEGKRREKLKRGTRRAPRGVLKKALVNMDLSAASLCSLSSLPVAFHGSDV